MLRPCLSLVATIFVAVGMLVAARAFGQETKYPGGKVDFKVAAKDLVREFVKTPEKATKKYDGKTLRVEGAISSLEVEKSEDATVVFVFLEGDDLVKVEIVLSGERALKLKAGQTIAVFGKDVAYAAGGGLVTLYQCELAK